MDWKVELFLPGDIIEVLTHRNQVLVGTVTGVGDEKNRLNIPQPVVDYRDDLDTIHSDRWAFLDDIIAHKRLYPERGLCAVHHHLNDVELCAMCGNEYHAVRDNPGDYYHCSVCKAV